ncbi:MAG: glycosyltransferase [Chloroflexi bacterium HGW-Chloroflexi-6]|nr:MAG: glycosyltransferase [Chloroflexi bacterium HGW-Chloroflexi-6]
MVDQIGWLGKGEFPNYADAWLIDTSWPKISIVTPSYNQDQYLEETIRSVLLQGYQNLEYIIVDDCSTDSSVEIIKKYESSIIFVANEKNGGQADTLNKGFSRSTGEIMASINGDDVYLPYTLNLVARLFRQFPEIDWITGHSSFLVDGQVISPRRNHLDAYNSKLMRSGFNTSWLMGVPQHISTFFRRSLYDKAGGFINNKDNYHSLDIDLWIRMAEFSAPVFVPATLSTMRLHGQQQSVTVSKNVFAEIENGRYSFMPLSFRKLLWWGMRNALFRGMIRRTMFNGKAQRLSWNYHKKCWDLENCYVF